MFRHLYSHTHSRARAHMYVVKLENWNSNYRSIKSHDFRLSSPLIATTYWYIHSAQRRWKKEAKTETTVICWINDEMNKKTNFYECAWCRITPVSGISKKNFIFTLHFHWPSNMVFHSTPDIIYDVLTYRSASIQIRCADFRLLPSVSVRCVVSAN